MIVLREKVHSGRSLSEVFAYACEFANCEQWDATAIRSEKTRPGPTGVGTEYDVVCALPVGSLTLRYRVLEWQPEQRVVLAGHCRWFTVTDTITVEPRGQGSELNYQAVFEFGAGLGALAKVIRPGLERMGTASIAGLASALNEVYAAPKARRSTVCADQWIVPGLARFSKWGYQRGRKHWHPLSVSMVGKHVVLTGGTSGIGLAAARRLAAMGARLTLVVRDKTRGEALLKQLRQETGSDHVQLELADMSVMADVQGLVSRLVADGRAIDVLINNAGALFNPRQVTHEGFEKSVALLLFGPVLLTEGLLPLLSKSAEPRVINVVSGGMYTQKLAVADLQSEHNYSGSIAYARAKRALMVTTEQWAERWAKDGIVVNAMHPGWADTPGVEEALPAFYKVTRRILRTPEQGADTIVWLGAAPEAARVSGELFLDREPHSAHLLKVTRERPAEREKLSAYLANELAPYRRADTAEGAVATG